MPPVASRRSWDGGQRRYGNRLVPSRKADYRRGGERTVIHSANDKGQRALDPTDGIRFQTKLAPYGVAVACSICAKPASASASLSHPARKMPIKAGP